MPRSAAFIFPIGEKFGLKLKSMLNQGLITQSQYQEESQKILNQLAE
jgi:hypothetical protein